MGQVAIDFWWTESGYVEEEKQEKPFEDISLLANGETDEDWKYGSD